MSSQLGWIDMKSNFSVCMFITPVYLLLSCGTMVFTPAVKQVLLPLNPFNIQDRYVGAMQDNSPQRLSV
jgi:hypothetical protein